MKRIILCMALMHGHVLAQGWHLDLGVTGRIEFVLTDPTGRREGKDPRSGVRYREINNSYGVFSIDSEDPDVQAPDPIMEFVWWSPIPGEYRLTIVGVRQSTFRIDGILSAPPSLSEHLVVDGVIDSLQAVEYLFHFDTTGRDAWIRKIVDVHSLRKDLDNCYELGLLGARPLYIDLSNRVEKYEKWMERKEMRKARHELEKLREKVEDVYEKTKRTGRDKKLFIVVEAYRILTGDINELLRTAK